MLLYTDYTLSEEENELGWAVQKSITKLPGLVGTGLEATNIWAVRGSNAKLYCDIQENFIF